MWLPFRQIIERRPLLVFALLLALAGCSGGDPPGGDGGPDGDVGSDSDGDGIGDEEEGASSGRDSDGDGIPDYQDLDSDDNGIADRDEGTTDTDGDGLGDWIDPDDDGDHVTDVEELGPDPLSPLDSDGDGTPDFRDLDSDGDTIGDLHEYINDEDGDGLPDRLDLDSDGDGIPDAEEAGDDDVATSPVDTDGDFTPDFRDLDSDADGLSDEVEWINGPAQGTDFRSPDSDGDGVSDMVEWAAGTGIDDPTDNPRTRGDFVFLVPFEEEPDPPEDSLGFSTSIRIVDVYFLVDRSGTMRDEILSIKDRLSEVIEQVSCAPGEEPAGGCIEDLWVGFGWFTDAGLGSYHNVRNLTNDYAGVQAAIPDTTLAATNECQRKAVYCVAHGPGGECPDNAATDDEHPCPAGRIGYPCFRPDAARLLVLVTDEDLDQDLFPTDVALGYELNRAGISFVGLDAQEGGNPALEANLRALARAAGQAPGAEWVYRGDDEAVVEAVVAAIEAVVNTPFDVGALARDEPSDEVDATRFIDYLEVNSGGSAECTTWPDVADSTGDGYADRFLGLPPGTPVCWDVHARTNDFVPAREVPQMFQAVIEVRGSPGETLLDSRDVYFLVPPDLYVPPPPD